MKKQQSITKGVRFYTIVLKFYPKDHQKYFNSEIMQTFTDHYKDVMETDGKVGLGFWASVISDELKGIVKENATYLID